MKREHALKVAVCTALLAILLVFGAVALADNITVIEYTTYVSGANVVEQYSITGTYDGYKINNYMALSPWTFVFDPSMVGTTDMTRQQILDSWVDAMGEWNDHLATPMFNTNYTTESVNISFASATANYNGKNTISFAQFPTITDDDGNTTDIVLAKTWAYLSTETYLTGYPVDRLVIECDVAFNRAVTWIDATDSNLSGHDMQSIATHELGHTLGLGDVTNQIYYYVTMYGRGSPNVTYQRSLDQLDLIGLSKLYKVPGYPSPDIATPTPTVAPTATPTPTPTPSPTPTPTTAPTAVPTQAPTTAPTTAPSITTAIVNTSSGTLNMRIAASSSATILTRIPKGATVQVLQRGSEWSRVSYLSYTGYVSNAYLLFNTIPVTPTTAPTSTATTAPAVTSTPTPAQTTAYVNVSTRLNVRSQPNASASLVTQLYPNTLVTVLSQSNGWARISYGSINGYVMATYLRFNTSPTTQPTAAPTYVAPTQQPVATPTPSTLQTARVIASSLNLRQSPSTSSSANIVTSIPYGATVTVTQLGAEWSTVRYGSYAGYVATRYLQLT